jgi:hypothetical protein
MDQPNLPDRTGELRTILKAIRTLNIHAKEFNRNHNNSGGEHWERRRDSLYRTKEHAVAALSELAAAAEQHLRGGEETVALYFIDGTGDQWAFHIPYRALPSSQLNPQQRVSKGMDHNQNPQESMPLNDALTTLNDTLGINANSFIETESVWVGGTRHQIAWRCLPSDTEKSDANTHGGHE